MWEWYVELTIHVLQHDRRDPFALGPHATSVVHMIIQALALLAASLTRLAWIIRIEVEVLSIWLSFPP